MGNIILWAIAIHLLLALLTYPTIKRYSILIKERISDMTAPYRLSAEFFAKFASLIPVYNVFMYFEGRRYIRAMNKAADVVEDISKNKGVSPEDKAKLQELADKLRNGK